MSTSSHCKCVTRLGSSALCISQLLGPADWPGHALLMGVGEAQEDEQQHARNAWDWLWWDTSVHMLLVKASHVAKPKSHGKGVDAERSEESAGREAFNLVECNETTNHSFLSLKISILRGKELAAEGI